ncbi:hypothetical protein D3C80_1999260 [compost metagenome]
MSAEEYADFKDLLVEVAGNRTQATEEQPEVVQEVVEQITVETPVVASLNIESVVVPEVKPFSHLFKN